MMTPNNNVFISLLMSLYSDNISSLILRKEKTEFINLVQTLLAKYSINSEKSISFFNIITPDIILLKFLKFTKDDEMRNNILENGNFDIIKLNYIYNILDSLDINVLHFIKKKEYNDFYFYDRKIREKIPEIILVELNNNYNVDKEIKYIGDTKTFFQKILTIDNIKYNLEAVIMKSTNTEKDYLILFEIDNKKTIYEINTSKIINHDWELDDVNYNFKTEDGTEILYNYDNTLDMMAIYKLISS